MSIFQLPIRLIEFAGQFFLNIFRRVPQKITDFGFFFMFVIHALREGIVRKIRWTSILQQMQNVGVRSMFIVILTAVFTGMVMALQTGRAFSKFQADTLTGAVCMLSIVKELGPVLAALMITARSGSAMAAQLGTMQVTQQIDALVSMAINPMGFLVAPRIIAAVIVTPILTAMFDFMGYIGSYIVGVQMLKINEAVFIDKIVYYVGTTDIVEGLFKSAIFGLILSSISCYKGFFTKGGAEGVGLSTTQAVVLSSVSILIFDYFLTALLF